MNSEPNSNIWNEDRLVPGKCVTLPHLHPVPALPLRCSKVVFPGVNGPRQTTYRYWGGSGANFAELNACLFSLPTCTHFNPVVHVLVFCSLRKWCDRFHAQTWFQVIVSTTESSGHLEGICPINRPGLCLLSIFHVPCLPATGRQLIQSEPAGIFLPSNLEPSFQNNVLNSVWGGNRSI